MGGERAAMEVERHPTLCGGHRCTRTWQRGPVQVFTSGAVVCRPTPQDVDESFHSVAVAHRDDGAMAPMLTLSRSSAHQLSGR
jgi:hypothetical protein